MGYRTPNYVILTGAFGSTSLNDSETVYFGCAWSATALATQQDKVRIYSCLSGVIRMCCVHVHIRTVQPSNENVTVNIRKNNTTDYLVATAEWTNTGFTLMQNVSMAVPIAAGDYIEFKVTTPAWVTNPTGVSVVAMAYLE